MPAPRLQPRRGNIIQSVAREVEVTRRLYRSGESEYLIDGQVCRLRDIHDLLMDTGLGAKAYAIIEQGKIGLILSSRPTDRRQLIEEAAGVTKYKARRRSAELKLEAAQQNLTRIDDIVFEVEKQRGTLKRQAGKARRYQKLRDELRRWEKVLFARKYRQLAETIESARGAAGRRARARSRRRRRGLPKSNRTSAACASSWPRRNRAPPRAREAAHARELAINRQQQQIAFDREQVRSARRARRRRRRRARRAGGAPRAGAARARGAARGRGRRERRARSRGRDARRPNRTRTKSAHREIEGLEADVEAARSEVFSAINSATALRHALEHAAAARDRVAETLSKLDVEDERRADRIANASKRIGRLPPTGCAARTRRSRRRAIARAARESELASARIEHEWRARSVRSREHELAGLDARLKSLEELDAGTRRIRRRARARCWRRPTAR